MAMLVLHYHEMWLKGGNRGFFVHKLTESVRLHLGDLGGLRVQQEDGRVLVAVDAEASRAVERARRIFGVANYSVVAESDRDLDAVAEVAWEQVNPQVFRTFAVRARRSDKTLPFRSGEAERRIGQVLLERLRTAGRDVAVDLDQPDLTCYVEFTRHRALVYSQKIPGPGGMPANTAGRLAALLSGGYDSAVASWLMMKRGAHLLFVHFHGVAAQPGESSAPVAREIVEILTPYQGHAKLYLVPFYELQREIVLHAPEELRILLYRRLMLRIVQALAYKNHALGIVTGDSLGQVASQTLQNMAAVGSVATLPVYRPLAGFDKQEIVALARRIGTYDASSEPFSDCCPAFMPRRPRLYARPAELDAAEAKLDVPGMVRRGLAAASREVFRFSDGRVVPADAKQNALV
jgi:thiamine biosynthesis protein ThiI